MINSPNTVIDFDSLEFKAISIDDFLHLKRFRCGNGSMETFLQTEAYISHIERNASTTLVFYKGSLVAYYTLKHTDLKLNSEIQDFEYTMSLDISRLAVCNKYQNIGIGSYIVKRIIKTAYEVNERFITLDALRERWEWYCNNFEFEPMFEDDIIKESPIVSLITDLYDEDLVRSYFDE